MKYTVFDVETPGLTPNSIHCLCATQIVDGKEGESRSFTNHEEAKSYLLAQECLVGHNIKRFDIPVIERIYGINLSHIRQIDTLGLSWYLYPNREKHGLGEWGEEYGIPKPLVEDWYNEPVEVYVHRCTEDVKINTRLFFQEMNYLALIYSQNPQRLPHLTGYLTWKLDCAAEQEIVRWKLDIEKTKSNHALLTEEVTAKTEALIAVMPVVKVYKTIERPAPEKFYKKGGDISVKGQKWLDYMEELQLPHTHAEPIQILVKEKAGNPNGVDQRKNWLFSLGWVPQTYDYKKEKDEFGRIHVRKIAQISLPNSGGICPSILLLAETHPEIEPLIGLFMAKHRLGILTAFLENVSEDGYLKAEIAGFTNTLRFIHKKPIVNLPTIHRKYGSMVRECLIAPEGYTLCGSDMSSLEDNTKRHYMWDYDPQYVTDMMTPGFDPHLDIAEIGGMLTTEQVGEHKLHDKTKGLEGKSHAGVRNISKKGNFSCTYGAYPKKIAESTGISIEMATIVFDAYWRRNWSINEIVKHTYWRTVEGQMWLYNPVSQFWYTLRYKKDIFSTLNQSTGVYCFDTQVRHVRNKGIKICGQFHDEIAFPVLLGDEQRIEGLLNQAIVETNNELKLNIKLGISVQFGNSYAAIH